MSANGHVTIMLNGDNEKPTESEKTERNRGRSRRRSSSRSRSSSVRIELFFFDLKILMFINDTIPVAMLDD